MKNQITIIIPTYYRALLVRRSIAYYEPLGIKVIIVDSSKTALQTKGLVNITYLHTPGIAFAKKISLALGMVETPYVCLCADDDFLSLNGLQSGFEFLRTNPDYASVQGTFIQFILNRKFLTYGIGDAGKQNYTIGESDISARVIHAFDQYKNCMYALYRTPVLVSAMNLACSVDEVTVVEISTNLVGNIYGKHTTLPVFWMARDATRYSNYLTVEGNEYGNKSLLDEKELPTFVVVDWEVYLKSSAGIILRAEFSKIFSNLTSESENVAGQIFDSALKAYIKRHIDKINKRKTTNSITILKLYLRKFLPVFILKWRRTRLEKRINPNLPPGYPSNSDVARCDWNLMSNIIKKYPI